MSIRSTFAITVLSALPALAQDAPAPPAPPVPPQVITMKASGSFLGVGVREVDSERAKTLRLPGEYGVEITKVDETSPAEKAGLKVGDVVQSYNGQRVEGTEQFVRMVRETPSGRTAQLGIVRGGSQQTISATIAARKAPNVFVTEGRTWPMPNMERDFEFVMPDVPKATMSWRSSMLGVEGESIGESQLASFFGVKEGVLVRSVIKETAAEKSGIKAGDVIVKIDNEKIDAPRDITAAIRAARKEGKKTIALSLFRDRKEMPLTVTLDDDSSSSARPQGKRVTVRKDEL